MKMFKLIMSIMLLFIAVVITGQYFEYFVNRPVATWIITLLGLLVLFFDILAIIVFSKILKKTLNL